MLVGFGGSPYVVMYVMFFGILVFIFLSAFVLFLVGIIALFGL